MGRAEDLFKQIKEKGFKAIEELIVTRQYEELFLDFKRSANNGNGTHLHLDDRKNLAKAVTGFGNSSGGIIIWGVDCRRDKTGADVPQDYYYIVDVKRFTNLLENTVSGCTLPPHSNIENYPIEKETGKGVVITYIGESFKAPHQNPLDQKFYIRAGSTFMPAPYGVIAGMFGKKPIPYIFHAFETVSDQLCSEAIIKSSLSISLVNDGMCIVKNIFINAFWQKLPNTCHQEHVGTTGLSINDPTNFCGNSFEHQKVAFYISKENYILTPGAYCVPITLTYPFKPPFEQSFSLKIVYGCENGPVREFCIGKSKEELQEIYDKCTTTIAANGKSYFFSELVPVKGVLKERTLYSPLAAAST